MDPASPEDKARFELRPAAKTETDSSSPDDLGALGEEILRFNVSWFIRLRWLVIGMLLVLLALTINGFTRKLGLDLKFGWLAGLAMLLAVVNLLYWLHQRSQWGQSSDWTTHANLWIQIGIDLAAVTVVVHFVGSSSTFAPFLYVIHIVLACIFFAPRQSLLVVLLSAGLYSFCVVAEFVGWLSTHQVYVGLAEPHLPTQVRFLQMSSAILLWISIWALAARLSKLLRRREAELLQANQRVRRTLEISQDHMHHTSHQMKAPLDAIRSNISLLEGGFAGELSSKARELIGRIEVRSDALSEFIQDMLQLAKLKAGEDILVTRETVALDELLTECLNTVHDQAEGRNVAIQTSLEPAVFVGDPEALRMLFDNLLTNAVNYSHDDGKVEVSCRAEVEDWAAVVQVRDHGIGIPADAVGRIFEDYFRTREAKQHNPQSTGVGMAIVKQVALQHGLVVEVESKVAAGTTFTVRFPAMKA